MINKFILGAICTILSLSIPNLVLATSFGSNVIDNGTVYYIDSDNTQRAYTSAGAFLSYGFNHWEDVLPPTAFSELPRSSFIAPADGSLINDHGTVYLITNGFKAGFTSPQIFTGLSYSWSNIIAGDTSFLNSLPPLGSTSISHPDGTVVIQDNTAYLIASYGKVAIPTLDIFNSWGYSWSKVVPANFLDNQLPLLGSLATRAIGQLSYNGGTLPYGDVTLQGIFGGSWYPPMVVDSGTTIFMNTQNYGQLKLNWPGFIQCQSDLSYQPITIGENFEVRGNYTSHGIDICFSSSYYVKKI